MSHLEDEALVQMAYALGLAGKCAKPAAWNPAQCVPQARELFWQLRERPGWILATMWIGARPEGQQGCVDLFTPAAHYSAQYGSVAHDEARAFLVVSVCAVYAAQQEQEA